MVVRQMEYKGNLEHISLRLFQYQIVDIKRIVKEDPERYGSFSHFIRVAIMRHLKEGK